jgi:hypothetical protein
MNQTTMRVTGNNEFMTSKLKHRFIDDSFDRSQSEKYKLSIRFAPDGFSFCIGESNSNRMAAMGHIMLNSANALQLAREIDLTISEEPLLQGPFQRVSACFESNRFCVVPSSQLDEVLAETLFDCTFEQKTDEALYQAHLNFDLSLITGVPRPIVQNLKKHYTNVQFQAPIFPVLNHEIGRFRTQPLLFVHLSGHLCQVVTFTQQGFHSAVSYTIHAASDALYHILNVVRQLQFDPLQLEIKLSGRQAWCAQLTEQLKAYVGDVKPTEPSKTLHLPATFKTEMLPEFILLVEQALCE